MIKRISAAVLGAVLAVAALCPMRASALEHIETPDYKVAFFAFDCYHMQDENGKIVSGDYSTYNGIRVGLLSRHTILLRLAER